MISRQDCMLLLTEMQDNGLEVKDQFNKLFTNETLPEVIKFINDNRSLDLVNFYYKIRKSYNNKKSKLYINLVKNDDCNEVVTTLASLQLQILLFAKNLENPDIFLRSARAEEISAVLNNYFKTKDLTTCQQLLNLIKADAKVCYWLNNGNWGYQDNK